MNTVEGVKVAEDITFRESQSDALLEIGRTHSSNEGQPMNHRTCIDGSRGRL